VGGEALLGRRVLDVEQPVVEEWIFAVFLRRLAGEYPEMSVKV